MTWKDVLQACESSGYEMFETMNQFDNDRLSDYTENVLSDFNGSYWIGLTEVPFSLKLLDGKSTYLWFYFP